MTYSTARYQLTHLLQDAWTRMGQMRVFSVTGGSLTTTVNSAWAGVDDEIYEDDDGQLIFGSVVVIEDAGGAGAAPEGEIARITDYDSSTWTITHDAVSSSIASGDRVGLVSPIFPLQDMIGIANTALRSLGYVDVQDTSITIVAGQTEYSLPIYKKPKRIRIQRNQAANDNEWDVVQGWRVIPKSAGTVWTLEVPVLATGYTLEVLYEGLHPKLNSYDDDISESIHPDLAVKAVIAEALQWYNNTINGANTYFVQRENKALQDLEIGKQKMPILLLPEQVQGMPHWQGRSRYVPLTSDERA